LLQESDGFKECVKVVHTLVHVVMLMSNNYHSPSLSLAKLVMRASLLFTVVEAITVLPPKFVSTR